MSLIGFLIRKAVAEKNIRFVDVFWQQMANFFADHAFIL